MENKDTCAYCDKHIWSDTKEYHVCLLDSSKKEFDESCERFKKGRLRYGR